ncbi:MAG: NUDIX domain-containing protein [Mariniphaga sp.]|nr:NUDIX domain-containing protein [Mariniphaga sp.]
MYKVFLNDRIFAIASEFEISSEFSDYQQIRIVDEEDVLLRVNHLLKSSEKLVFISGRNEKLVWKNFKKCFLIIRAAGGVVKQKDQILFIFRKGKWDLPKGKIDKGESADQAVQREVGEECGISNLKITKQLPSTWHIYQSPYKKNKGEWILKETIWFEMEYKGSEKLIPQIEEDITKAEWISQNKLKKVLKNIYRNLEQIIELYL